MALISLGSSIWFAVNTESDAAAINIAGSLRMQSWRLSEHVLIPELTSQDTVSKLVLIFDNSINNPALSRLQLRQDHLGAAYRSVVADWYQVMRPLLSNPKQYPLFVDGVPVFVDDIDQMVKKLQLNSESKLDWLLLIAAVFLIGILTISIAVIIFIKKNLLEPVISLGAAAENVRQGQFHHLELTYDGSNELGQLTNTFQEMANDLSQLYDNLEGQVARQTQALEQSNTALHLLYKASRNLGVNPYDEQEVLSLIESWKQLLELKECYICLSDKVGSEQLYRINAVDAESGKSGCSGHCLHCIRKQDWKTAIFSVSEYRFDLVIEGQMFGFLYVATTDCQMLSEESKEWLQTFADIVAGSLHQSRNRNHERQVLLMEERAVIARELHDSLAQALSYQKIQVVRLKRQLGKIEKPPIVADVMNELQEGLNHAYRQLRELLNTFRLSISEGDLETALENTLKEYRKRQPDIEYQLDYQLQYRSLDAHHQIHIVHIVREALSNVLQHAQATQVIIRCRTDECNSVVITVDDNGKGISTKPEKTGHFGTTIMQERAETMGGVLHFEQAPMGGARVSLALEST